ncbi:DUF742 domain-containing protein [Saccharothrix algeriensis]|uniref:DUF742 domain-containing protein n=1 Tax=Saccharothrix algeriensis TaxID=173560 RepID=A0A8T8HY42_9PSEU|nr:DUF742 domain-containing protein [Saccharothrix algeriensis]MBM7815078.1 hypothetical protein [Saccharothrix algeriensis]QTR03331.1 DUF742 domain-containing protein [Saccharothrix algeriensis]
MSPRLHDEDPDRLYTITGGRSRVHGPSIDLVTLIVSESEPSPGMQSEHVRILRTCRRPTAVVELSAELGLPVGVVRILLCDLLDAGVVTARHPRPRPAPDALPSPDLLKRILLGLQKL